MSTTTPAAELKPCPFCGAPVTMHYTGSSDWEFECSEDADKCGASVIFWVRAEDEPTEARRRWNARAVGAAPEVGPLRELGSYLARVLDEDQFATAEALLLKSAHGVGCASLLSEVAALRKALDDRLQLTDAQKRAMVDRFLAWKLPADFGPDTGITFTPYMNATPDSALWPSGTCLLTATQAHAMLEHMLEALK
jgi:hypothetical protein